MSLTAPWPDQGRYPRPVPSGVRVVSSDDPAAVDVAAEALAAGQGVVLPTDTVYGVAALPGVAEATARLFALKNRPEAVPLAVLVADPDQAGALGAFTPVARRLADRYWPGPLTLVLRRRPAALALALGGSPDTVGLRCPDHDFVRALARRVGPVATTSANRHGEPTPATAAEAAAALAGAIAIVIDGGPCAGVQSTVVDCTDRDLRVLRPGAITEEGLR